MCSGVVVCSLMKFRVFVSQSQLTLAGTAHVINASVRRIPTVGVLHVTVFSMWISVIWSILCKFYLHCSSIDSLYSQSYIYIYIYCKLVITDKFMMSGHNLYLIFSDVRQSIYWCWWHQLDVNVSVVLSSWLNRPVFRFYIKNT